MLALRRGVRMQADRTTNCMILLFPEGLVELNDTAHEVLRRLPRPREALRRDLCAHYGVERLDGFDAFLDEAHASKWLETPPPPGAAAPPRPA
mgnify:CR=1 FL=1